MNTAGFYPLKLNSDIPTVFPSPFDVLPHVVAQQAAESLKQRLPELCGGIHSFDTPDGGKMFGVLVVQNSVGEFGYLSAFSGMLGNRWECTGFVPQVFDLQQRESLLHKGEQQVAVMSGEMNSRLGDPAFIDTENQLYKLDDTAQLELESLKAANANRKQQRHKSRAQADLTQAALDEMAHQSRNDKIAFKQLRIRLAAESRELRSQYQLMTAAIDKLRKQRKKLSQKLQAQVFTGYQLRSVDNQTRAMAEFFEAGLPPSGAGDCAAIKLVQYANSYQLKPIALAEFWWGQPPLGGLREHGRYYPSCRSRCRVLLPFLLSGLKLSVPLHEQPVELSDEYPHTLYADDQIVVVEKPAGLLSVPGKVLTDSVETRLKARYPEVQGVMLLHRLDQATSGVMIAARNPLAYKKLQHQFQDRTIQKKYMALLDGTVEQDQGSISLPLRVDIYDRPRQIVCADRGKASLTKYSVMSREAGVTRVAFYPHTGRTHQLRVHAAHSDGLNCAILGDELYGRPGNRLHLHAEQLSFDHPLTGRRMTLSSDVSF